MGSCSHFPIANVVADTCNLEVERFILHYSFDRFSPWTPAPRQKRCGGRECIGEICSTMTDRKQESKGGVGNKNSDSRSHPISHLWPGLTYLQHTEILNSLDELWSAECPMIQCPCTSPTLNLLDLIHDMTSPYTYEVIEDLKGSSWIFDHISLCPKKENKF